MDIEFVRDLLLGLIAGVVGVILVGDLWRLRSRLNRAIARGQGRLVEDDEIPGDILFGSIIFSVGITLWGLFLLGRALS